ncbi:MAG TPA: ATP-dependent Clp protease ATP-binding subunit, partial [Myxococcales bacterium]|nr:ATP-dependent Clp protease ATP-binding subunit [Myxococcales bacterium]
TRARREEPPKNRRKAPPPRKPEDDSIPETPLRPVARSGNGKPPETRAPRKRPSAARRPSITTTENEKPADIGPYDLDPGRFPLLCRLGRNLTAAAARGEIDPVIGRAHELDRLLDVLGRRRANNPVLVGPPGVG